MGGSGYRLDWARPPTWPMPGERAYHATDGTHHLLVVLAVAQLEKVRRLAESMRQRDPEVLLQHALEEAIATAIERRPPVGGKLRLIDSDFE